MDKEKREAALIKIRQAPELTDEVKQWLTKNLDEFNAEEIKSLFNRLRIQNGIFDTPLLERFFSKWLWDHEMLKPGRDLDENRARKFLTDEMLRFHKRLPKKDLVGLDILFSETPSLFQEVESLIIVPDEHGLDDIVLDEKVEQVDVVPPNAMAMLPANATAARGDKAVSGLFVVPPKQQDSEPGTTLVEESNNIAAFNIDTPDQETPPVKSSGGGINVETKREPQLREQLSPAEALTPNNARSSVSSKGTAITPASLSKSIEPEQAEKEADDKVAPKKFCGCSCTIM